MSGLERRLLEPDFTFPPSHAEAHPQARAEPPHPATGQPALDRLRRLPLPEYGRVASPARDDLRGERRSIGPSIDADRITRQDDRAPGQGRTPIAQAVAALPAAAPATPSAPTASATELGMVDLMLADPLNRELVAAWGGSAKLPDTDLARDQIARFGAERAGQMQRLARATATVRDEYQRAVDAAAAKPPPPPPFNPLTHQVDARELPPGWSVELLDISEGTPNYRTSFSIDAYTAWYAKQDSLAGRAFAALYGEAKTTVDVGENYERSTTTIADGLFTVHTGSWFGIDENGTRQAWQPGRLEASGGVVPIGLSTGRELHDRRAVWFDPALGFVTARENIVQKQDWLDKAAPIIITGAIMVATGGAGGLFSAAGGTGTIMGAVTTATGNAVLGAAALGAAGGALAATVNGAFSGNLSLKDIFRSALTGAVTGGVMQATGLNTLGLDKAGKVASYAQRAMAISGASTLQGALTALSGGRFADGFKNGLTAGIAQGLAAEVMHGMRADIAARVKSGQLSAVDASALRTLTQATGSAIRALANPQDPGFAFAAEFVGTLVNDGVQGLQHKGQGEGVAQPAPEDPHAAFRAAEHEARRVSDTSVAGTSYRAQAGDSISRIVGSSDPQAIGNFMRANNLTSDHIEVGRNYFVPQSTTAYGDSAALGWHALRQGNARHAPDGRSERPGELNRFAGAGEASGAEPVWSFREASMAQRRLDDERLLAEYQASPRSAPGMSAWDGRSSTGSALATVGTIDAIAANPFGALGYLTSKALGAGEGDAAAMAAVGAIGGDLLSLRAGRRAGGSTNLTSEAAALQRIAANNRAGTPWADRRQAYEQARGHVDFAHIEADVRLNASGGLLKAQGGHFYTSPLVDVVAGTQTVGSNGVVKAKVNLLGPDGIFHLKTNNNGYSTLTPVDWSLAQAKGEMSQAFLNRTLDHNAKWSGTSGGVEFRFHPPTSTVPLWRGYPIQTP